MGKFNCPRCGKTFKQKSHFETHKKRKNPCENTLDTVKELVEKAVEERLSNITHLENTFKPSSTNEEEVKTTEIVQNDIMNILDNTLKVKSYKDIASYLNVAVGTVKRWKELNSVPPSYQFDLMKLNDIPIDYSKFSYKEKDQFYTPTETAQKCFDIFQKFLKEKDETDKKYTYIEPSAGDGSFLKILPNDRTLAIDIEPKGKNIETADYLTWSPPSNKKYITFGNPPFGLRGQLALKFINHSANFSDYVCFILPQLFESDGKGVPRKRVEGYNLVYSEKLDTNFYEPSQKEIKVNCIFQIWSKKHTSDKYSIKKNDNDMIKIYSLSDGGTPSTTRNKKMFYKCDIYIPSTCFGKDNMTYYTKFDNLPRKRGYGIVFNKNKEQNIIKFKNIKWCDVAFLSTNSAYNIRTSQITEQFV